MNKRNFIILIISILFIIITVNEFLRWEERIELKNNKVETIAKVFDTDFTGKMHGIKYGFYVDSKFYTGHRPVDSRSKYMNKFYKVVYSKINPWNNEVILDKEIKDSLKIVKAGFKLRLN